MNDSLELFVFLVLLGLSAFFAASETAFFTLSPLRLKKLEEEGDTCASEVLKLLERRQQLLTTLLLGSTLANVTATAMATHWLLQAVQRQADQLPALLSQNPVIIGVAAAALGMTLLLVVGGEIIPRLIAQNSAQKTACRLVRPVRVCTLLFMPLTWVLMRLVQPLTPSSSGTPTSTGTGASFDEIDSYFSLGEEVGIIERDEKEMISSVFEFGDTLVREVMVPRPDIVSVPITMKLDDLLKLVREDGHSRFPVYEASLDKILGVLYVKDLLMRYDEIRASFDLHKLLRSVYFVPETKKLDDLLREFQKRKSHMAMVVDEFGGVSGLVTIEDLLEEIVGEIVDEYDLDEQAQFVRVNDHTFVVDARMSISDLETELQ
ncbi:MAG TPA: hemolysin family protein, partial [Candidatus Ozemobacteraceae bacterium]|nr:hemolysin family protein [Candidatus Ozemobacteraceae bacterium]